MSVHVSEPQVGRRVRKDCAKQPDRNPYPYHHEHLNEEMTGRTSHEDAKQLLSCQDARMRGYQDADTSGPKRYCAARLALLNVNANHPIILYNPFVLFAVKRMY